METSSVTMCVRQYTVRLFVWPAAYSLILWVTHSPPISHSSHIQSIGYTFILSLISSNSYSVSRIISFRHSHPLTLVCVFFLWQLLITLTYFKTLTNAFMYPHKSLKLSFPQLSYLISSSVPFTIRMIVLQFSMDHWIFVSSKTCANEMSLPSILSILLQGWHYCLVPASIVW